MEIRTLDITAIGGEPVVSFDIVFLIAIVAGFFGALTGLGGGTVIVPVLALLGVDIKLAIAASMVSVIATSCSSAAIYVRQGLVNLKAGMFLEMFTVVGAVIGASVTQASGRQYLFIAFGAVLIAAGISLIVKQRLSPRPATGRTVSPGGWTSQPPTTTGRRGDALPTIQSGQAWEEH